MHRRLISTCLLLFTSYAVFSQTKFTISGFISDAGSKEKLRNASVIISGKTLGTSSNDYGFYSITLPTDSVTIVFSYSGYKSETRRLLLDRNILLDVLLEPDELLDEIVISTEGKNAIQNTTRMSTIGIPIETIKALPRFLGEVDIIKAIQMLPGVQAGQEGQSGLYVRGGGPDQNLVLLDGVPVYNVSHLFGFFSVFNADAVKSVEIIKGGFPARFGGRLSSVLDIQMKEGNKEKLHGEGGIGIVASRVTLEGPFKKGKPSSFMVSARRTYIDILAKPLILSQGDGEDVGYYFYDLNAKANVKLGRKDHLYLSGYFGKDKFYSSFKDNTDAYKESDKLSWGNATAVVRWNHLFSSKIFGNLTANFTRYLFDVSSQERTGRTSEFFKLRYFSGIRDLSAQYYIDFIPSPNHYIKVGTGVTFHEYKPGVLQIKENSAGFSSDTSLNYNFLHSTETASYIEDDIRISKRLKVNTGLHFSTFSISGKSFSSLQPRLSARFLINPDMSIKASYATMSQYIHLLTNAGIGLPTDLWVPATAKVPPQSAQQVAAGVAYNLKNDYEFSLEGYYKKMKNVIEYAEGASYLNVTSNWEDKVEVGEGDSYGIELFAQRKVGRISGLLGYTLSWTNRYFENLNFGIRFPYRYDRRHDIKIAGVWKISKKTEASANWIYGTGQAITLPTQKYIDPRGDIIEVNSSRNGYRMPASHRLDVSISFSKEKKRHTRSWIFSIYNVYNRRNPFYIFLDTEPNTQKPVFKQVTLFPIIPSFTYQFKF